jgi:hypothetical protein
MSRNEGSGVQRPATITRTGDATQHHTGKSLKLPAVSYMTKLMNRINGKGVLVFPANIMRGTEGGSEWPDMVVI